MSTQQPEALPPAFLHYPPKKPALARVDFMQIATKSERGAGWVTVPLIGQPQAMPDLSQLTERGAKAWAGVDAQGLREGLTAADMATASAQGFRDGVASVSAGSEPMATVFTMDALAPGGGVKYHATIHKPLPAGTKLYTHPSPTEGMSGWISVKDRLPEKNTKVLICFAELSIPSTGQYTASALDHEGWCYPQENHLWPGERPDFEDGGSPTVTHWMPLPAAPGPADGESNG